jgi:hypothetical protein
MSRKRGPACVLPRCPFFPPRESNSHTRCVTGCIEIIVPMHVHYFSPPPPHPQLYTLGAGWWRDDQTRLFSKKPDMTPCVDRVKDGWLFCAQASKQAESRSKNSLANSRWFSVWSKAPQAKTAGLVWSLGLVWICSDPNTALLYPTRQDLGVLAVGSHLLLFQSIETVSQQRLFTGSCQS